jgi:anti-sigma B factor antagonist
VDDPSAAIEESLIMSEIIPPTPLLSSVRHEGTTALAFITGEIDLHNSPVLRGALLNLLAEGGIDKLILNLADVPYMDSSAIAVLVESLQKLRKINGKICLTNLQPRVKGLLEIARLDTIFVVAADEAEAKKK